jgi:MFS family permease
VEVSLLFYVTFAATLLGRPLGALVFGHLADTLGRRRLTLVSIAGFSSCTLLIGLLPGYAVWGTAAPLALVGLRFLDGVFLGGEYTAATPLAFEHCPHQARGLFGGLLMGAYAAAYAAVSAVVLLLLTVLPPADYAIWGWRVPFVAGAVLGFVFLLYRTGVPESTMWQRSRRERRPLQVLLRGPASRDLVQVLLMMTGLWLVATSVVSVLPRLLTTELHRSPQWTTGVLLVAQVGVLVGFAVTGALSQRLGRRRTLVAGAGVSTTAGLGCYLLVLTGDRSAGVLAVLVVLTEVLVLSVWGVVTSYCNERFATCVRSSGFGVAYSLGVVPSSFYAVYMAALATVIPFHLTQLVLLVAGAALTVLGARLGPETVDVRLEDVRAHARLETAQ